MNNILFAAAITTLSLFGADYDYTANDKPSQFGDGVLTFAWENDKISSITKRGAENAALSSASGHILNFAPDAVVTVEGGSIEFNLPIQGEGSLSFLRPNNILSFDRPEGLSENQEIKVFENVNINDVVSVKCLYNKHTFYSGIEIQGVGLPYHIVREDGWLSAQFQCTDGAFTKAIKVIFIQVENDVYAIAEYAKYIQDKTKLGADFDTLEGAQSRYLCADTPNKTGYSIDYIEMLPNSDATLQAVVRKGITGSVTVTNTLAGGLVFSGDGSLSETGAYAGDFYAGEKIVFRNHFDLPLELSGSFYGEYGRHIVFDADVDEAELAVDASTIAYDGKTTISGYTVIADNWQRVAQGVPLSEIDSVSVDINGYAIKNGELVPNVPAKLVSFDEKEKIKWFQASVYDSWYKTSNILLREVIDADENIFLEVKATNGLYCAWANIPGGTEEEKLSYVITSIEDASAKGGGRQNQYYAYGSKSIKITHRPFTKKVMANSTLEGENHIERGVLEVAGSSPYARATVKLTNANSLPPSGSLEIRANGIVELRAQVDMNLGYNSSSCVMNIHPGGELRHTFGAAFGNIYGQIVNNDGGRLVFGHGTSDATKKDSGTYLRFLNLSNGARVLGEKYPRVGYTLDGSHWTSSGSMPNTVDCGITLVGKENGVETELKFTCSSDLILNGEICTYADITSLPLTNCVIKKYGPANAVHNGNNISPAPIRVYEGAWVLGKSNSVSASKRFELHGGSLALADNVEQSLDVLPLKEEVSCGVTLGEDAVLELGTIDFGEGTKLAITGPEVRDGAVTKLRIGTSACLDNVALSKMRYNTKRVKQNADGWIKTSANALVISIR